MTVLPVTLTVCGSVFSRSRLSRLVVVGHRCRVVTWLMSRRLASSGKGEEMSPVRRPASTWRTGTSW